MLSERERRALREIERGLDSTDPELAERLSGMAAGPARAARRYWVGAGAMLAMLLVLSMGTDMPIATLLLVLGSSGLVLAGCLYHRRHQAE